MTSSLVIALQDCDYNCHEDHNYDDDDTDKHDDHNDDKRVTCYLLSSYSSPRLALVSVGPWPRVVCVIVILLKNNDDDLYDDNDDDDDDDSCLGPMIWFSPR